MEDPFAYIDLLTYDGEDPRFSEESVCQNCLAKESETPLERCPNCSAVFFCSECALLPRNHPSCSKIVRFKNYMDIFQQKLMQEHNININHPNGQGRALYAREVRRANDPNFWLCLGLHEPSDMLDITRPFDLPLPAGRMRVPCILANYSTAAFWVSDELRNLAVHSNTRELHEAVLDLCVRNLKLVRYDSSPSFLRTLAENTAFTLIHLNRLDDAFCFIRNYMAFQAAQADRLLPWCAASPRLHELHGEPDSRYKDCLGWMRPLLIQAYPLWWSYEKSHYYRIILALMIIKLRVRVPSARQAWERTLKDVFFKTGMGWALEPAFLILKDMILLGYDDHEPLEQIRGLMAMIHVLDRRELPRIMGIDEDDNLGAGYLDTESRAMLSLGSLSLVPLRNTPGALELLSEEFHGTEFSNRWINETLVQDIDKKRQERRKKRIYLEVFGTFCLFGYVVGLYHYKPESEREAAMRRGNLFIYGATSFFQVLWVTCFIKAPSIACAPSPLHAFGSFWVRVIWFLCSMIGIVQ